MSFALLRPAAIDEALRAMASDLGPNSDTVLEMGVPEGTATGVEGDLDMVWVVAWPECAAPMAKAFLIVGRSILTGRKALDYALAWVGEDEGYLAEFMQGTAEAAADFFVERGGFGGFFLSEIRDDEIADWRSFRGVLPTADEVLARNG